MTDINDLVQQLAEVDEEALQIQLGKQAQRLAADLTESASIDSIDVEMLEAVPRGGDTDKALELGQRLFKRLNAEAYDLMCGSDPFGDGGKTMQQIEAAYKGGSTQAAGVIAPILVASLGLAPAIAAIISTLIVQKFAKATGDTICGMWKESMD
ncbi:MAG: hypothetical protein LRZ84_12845 [Desertifilum sp.]|nr:hypothetical protein [Desertifilum sp.]